MTDAAAERFRTVDCPHCKKRFEAPLLEGSAPRYSGFKCPHCRLFVPLDRVEETAEQAS